MSDSEIKWYTLEKHDTKDIKDGHINGISVLKGIGGGCDEEAVRVVGSMPDWKPGYDDGEPVDVEFRMPIRFTLK